MAMPHVLVFTDRPVKQGRDPILADACIMNCLMLFCLYSNRVGREAHTHLCILGDIASARFEPPIGNRDIAIDRVVENFFLNKEVFGMAKCTQQPPFIEE